MRGNFERLVVSPENRRLAATIGALFLATRGILLTLAYLFENVIPRNYHGPTYATSPVLQSLTAGDANYLLGIAAKGYHAEPVVGAFRDWPFFPLFPLLTRATSVLTGGDVALAGVIVANLAFVAALVVLYKLAEPVLGADRALKSLAFVALAPGAVAFGMAYSDSTFLLLAAGSVLAAQRGRWALVAALYALACLTRLQGLLLAVPLAIVIVERAGGWRAGGWRTPTLAWLAAGPLAFALFAVHLGLAFGQPLGMLTAQQTWAATFNNPAPSLAPGASAPAVVPGAVPVDAAFGIDPVILLFVGLLGGYLFLLVYLRVDGIPLAHRAYAIVSVAATLLAVLTNRTLLLSNNRYMAVVWPFSWVLAGRRAAWFEATAIGVSGLLFALFAVLNLTQALAP
jgi:hypothetical protein